MPLITISNIALSGKIQNHEFRKESSRRRVEGYTYLYVTKLIDR